MNNDGFGAQEAGTDDFNHPSDVTGRVEREGGCMEEPAVSRT